MIAVRKGYKGEQNVIAGSFYRETNVVCKCCLLLFDDYLYEILFDENFRWLLKVFNVEIQMEVICGLSLC